MTATHERAFVNPYDLALSGEGGVLAPRLTSAWLAACEFLSDGKRHPYAEVLGVMAAAGGVAHGTARNLLWVAANAGLVTVTPYDPHHPRAKRHVCRPVGAAVFARGGESDFAS